MTFQDQAIYKVGYMDCHDWAHEVFNQAEAIWLLNTGYVLCHRLNMQVVGSKLDESQEAILTAIHIQLV